MCTDGNYEKVLGIDYGDVYTISWMYLMLLDIHLRKIIMINITLYNCSKIKKWALGSANIFLDQGAKEINMYVSIYTYFMYVCTYIPIYTLSQDSSSCTPIIFPLLKYVIAL